LQVVALEAVAEVELTEVSGFRLATPALYAAWVCENGPVTPGWKARMFFEAEPNTSSSLLRVVEAGLRQEFFSALRLPAARCRPGWWP
jgi:hypothetical protein